MCYTELLMVAPVQIESQLYFGNDDDDDEAETVTELF